MNRTNQKYLVPVVVQLSLLVGFTILANLGQLPSFGVGFFPGANAWMLVLLGWAITTGASLRLVDRAADSVKASMIGGVILLIIVKMSTMRELGSWKAIIVSALIVTAIGFGIAPFRYVYDFIVGAGAQLLKNINTTVANRRARQQADTPDADSGDPEAEATTPVVDPDAEPLEV